MFRRSLAEVIAGGEGLDRELRWAHVIEMADPSDLLKGGELVLTTGIGPGRGARPGAVDPFADRPGRRRRCGRAGLHLARARARARGARAPRRACRWSPSGARCASSRSPRLSTAVVNSQFELLRRGEEIHRRFTELILHGRRGVPEILGELASAVGNPVVLEDAGHELVYYVSGRAGDDLALSAWADLHRAEDRGETPEGARWSTYG